MKHISILIMGVIVPFNVYGECTPAPDCASIGYTETSCEGDSLKCPFDTTMLKCMPCDSSFRYDCSGENITGGTGSACGGKYASCECVAGATFMNGQCICDTTCKIGAIYYSDGSCSSCVDNSKTAVGILVKENELVATLTVANIVWGGSTDISGLPNNITKSDYNGKSNTSIIVSEHTNNGLTVSNSAAMYCNSYSTASTSAGDWYLPAAGEVFDYLYGNYSNIKASWNKVGTTITKSNFWSSSEYGSNGAYRIDLNDGHVGWWYKDTAFSVACFLEI